jgi:XTP/dITP diphosphohydrolase
LTGGSSVVGRWVGGRLIVATRNEHKVRELRRALAGWEVEPVGALELPEETGETFYENARAKARFGRSHIAAGVWVAGEDSGLEVEALGGRPGVRSARYAGEGASDEENVAKLLEELAGIEARSARYVCELVCLTPEGDEVRAGGTLAGRIAAAPRGSEGFGYDPVFVPDGEERTVAELGDAWKAGNSHRAKAAHALAQALGAPAEPL